MTKDRFVSRSGLLSACVGLLFWIGSSQPAVAMTTAVSVTPLTATATGSQSIQFSAQVTITPARPLKPPNTAVTWTMSPIVGTISVSGLYNAPTTISTTQYVTVTATSAADPGASASATITLTPVTVSVTPAVSSLTVGQTQQFSATVGGTANGAVTWAVIPVSGSISVAGLYTAPASVTSTQTVTVTATSVADPTKFASAVVTLSPPVSVTVSPVSVTLTQSQTQSFAAAVVNSTNTAVTWSLSAAVGSISLAGLYTAPASITSTQNVTVKATSMADPTKSASATVTLAPPVIVALTPSSVSLFPSQTQTFAATVSGTSNSGVMWSLSPALGGLGSTTTSSVYSAPNAVSASQTVTLTATSMADPSKTATAIITLLQAVTVSLNPTAASLGASGAQQFSTVISGTSNTSVTWSISPATGSISQSGLYSAPLTVTTPQNVTVTATSVADSLVSAASVVSLNPVGVTVAPASVTLTQAQTQTFSATVTNTGNTAVTWSVSPSVGTISSSGLYTAPLSILTPQTVTVMAQSIVDPTKSASAVISLPMGTYSYYVDARNGSDSNPGTLAQPWKTIAKVNSAALIPGQSVGFASGAEWREMLTPGQDGTAPSPITFGAYGSGNQPIISGANLVSWTQGTGAPVPTTVWYTTQTTNPCWPSFGGSPGKQESSLNALTAANEWYWDGSSKLYVYSISNPAPTVEIPSRNYAINANGRNHLRFANLEIRGALLHGFDCYTNGSASCNDLNLSSMLVDLNYGHGIYIQTGSGGSATYGNIVSSTVTNNGGSCLVVGGQGPFSNWNISGNTLSFCSLYYSGSDNIHTYTGGIYLNTYATQDGGNGTVVSNNVIHDIGYFGENKNSGQCLWTDTTIGIVITRNTIYNCSASGLVAEKTLGQTITYNTIWNAGQAMYTAGLSIAAGGGFASRNNLFYNNTVYNNGGWWTLSIGWEDTNSGTAMSGNVITNNIIDGVGSSGDPLYVDSHSNNSVSASFSHNNFGAASGSCFFNYGNCYATYASFDGAYGSNTYSVAGDPLFVSPPTNFALQSNSPDIGAGVYVPGVNATNPTNIGAH